MPSQTRSNVRPARRVAIRERASRRVSPSQSWIQTASRSRVRSRKSDVRVLLRRNACSPGEKTESTAYRRSGDFSSFAPSVITNAAAVAASRARTTSRRQDPGHAGRFYAGVVCGEPEPSLPQAALPEQQSEPRRERERTERDGDLDDQRRPGHLDELDPGEDQHEAERDPQRALRHPDRELRAERARRGSSRRAASPSHAG